MILGLNDADCLAAGMRSEDLRSAADRFRSAGSRGVDRPARARGIAAARHGLSTLMVRLGARPRVTPPAALGTTR